MKRDDESVDKRDQLLDVIADARRAADRYQQVGQQAVRDGQLMRDLADVVEPLVRILPNDSALPSSVWDSQRNQWRTQADRMDSFVVPFAVVEGIASGTRLTTMTSVTVMLNPSLIPSLPDAIRPQMVAGVNRLRDLVTQARWIQDTDAEFGRLGLWDNPSNRRSPPELLREAQEAFDQPSTPSTSPTAVLIPARGAIHGVVDHLLKARPAQEPAPNWKEKIRSVGRQLGKSSVLPDEFDRMADLGDSLLDRLSAAKVGALARHEVRDLLMEAVLFVATLLRSIDEERLRRRT